MPGLIPGLPHALPTIFCARVKPLLVVSADCGSLKTSEAGSFRCSLAL